MRIGKAFSAITAACAALTMFTLPAVAEENGKDLVIYYTNDVHCGISDNLGYAALSALKQKSLDEGDNVLLADAGDSIQGAAIGTLTDGEYIVDIMNEVGYDIAIPGNHEYDYGMSNFLQLSEKAQYDYICSNFIDLATNKSVFKPYEIKEFDELKIAFIGITTPKTFSSSTPAFFQNEDGEYIYSFCQGDGELYENVQASIDSAKAEGADIVIGIAHLGIEPSCSPWMSTEVIANTSGLDAVIDGHSHSTIESDIIADKDGNDVILSSTGTKLAAIGKMTVTANGEIKAELVKEYDAENASETEKAAYDKTTSLITEKVSEFDVLLNTVVAQSDVDLITVDGDTGIRLIRNSETNLGDLCADAYREVLGADIGFINGGGIRADIAAGEITYGNIIAVHPFGNMACMVEVTGQQILDALEFSVSAYPEESGGFQHVSGLTYELHSYLPSTVTRDEHGLFSGVTGERRVKNVMIGGERLDPEKTYTLAGHNYMLKNSGDGYSMFSDCEILKDEVYVDNEVLIKYITENLGGVIGEEYENTDGSHRFTVFETLPKEEATEASTDEETAELTNEEATEDETVEPIESEQTEKEDADGESKNPITGVTSISSCLILLAAAVMLKARRK